MLLLNQIGTILTPCVDHHLAARVQDLFDELSSPHSEELLREDGRRELGGCVVSLVAIGMDYAQDIYEAQRVQANLSQHVDMVIII